MVLVRTLSPSDGVETETRLERSTPNFQAPKPAETAVACYALHGDETIAEQGELSPGLFYECSRGRLGLPCVERWTCRSDVGRAITDATTPKPTIGVFRRPLQYV